MKICRAALWSLLFFGLSSLAASEAPYLYVLGVAQDAGYPQARCYQTHCMRAWTDPGLKRLTSSVAVIDPAANARFLFDATPDIREQLFALHSIAPDTRYSLSGIFLTHAHIGHYTGLMHLGHEASGAKDIAVYAMPRMLEFLAGNGPWDQLVRYRNIRLVPLQHLKAVQATRAISIVPMRVPHRDEYSETVGYRITGPDKSALFIPDIDKWARWEEDIVQQVKSVDYALLDATFFADGELPERSMADVPHPFVKESMELFSTLSPVEKKRVIFIHFNHTNPLLNDGSDEYRQVIEAGYTVARQGMKLDL